MTTQVRKFATLPLPGFRVNNFSLRRRGRPVQRSCHSKPIIISPSGGR